MRHNKKKKWFIFLAAVLLLLVGALWYARPVTVHDLHEKLDPDRIAVMVLRVGETPDTDSRYDLSVQRGEAGFDALLQQITDLRFSRYPTNIFLQFFPALEDRTSRTTAIHGYDYHIYLALQDSKTGTWAKIHYSLGEWTYHDWKHDVFLPLRSVGQSGKEIGDTLTDVITQFSTQSK